MPAVHVGNPATTPGNIKGWLGDSALDSRGALKMEREIIYKWAYVGTFAFDERPDELVGEV